MNSLSIPNILRSVEVLYDPTQPDNEKVVASSILTQLMEYPDRDVIAMEILNISDPCIFYWIDMIHSHFL